jgi:hypothetical protein
LTVSERALKARLPGAMLQSHVTFVILDVVIAQATAALRNVSRKGLLMNSAFSTGLYVHSPWGVAARLI